VSWLRTKIGCFGSVRSKIEILPEPQSPPTYMELPSTATDHEPLQPTEADLLVAGEVDRSYA
jgi:hypothetical protein